MESCERRVPHRIAVRQISIESVLECHILFVVRLERSNLLSILDAVDGYPNLTVADKEGFAVMGACVNLVAQRGRGRLEINPDSMRGVGLTMSAWVLCLARIARTNR